MRVVDAVVVPSFDRWSRLVPAADAFDEHDAFAALDALADDARATVRAYAAKTGKRPPAALLDTLDAALSLGDWLASQRAPIGLREAFTLRSNMLAAGRRVYDALSLLDRGYAVQTSGVGSDERRLAGDESLLGAALVIGGIWLLDRWIGRGRR